MKSVNEELISQKYNDLHIEQFKEILYRLPVCVYTCDAEGYIEMYNDAAVQFWGRTPKPGEKWCGSWKLYNTDGTFLPHDKCPMAIALKEGRIVSREIIIERPDGTRYFAIPHPQPLHDSYGKIIGAVNTIIDITHLAKERKNVADKAAETLEKIEERYHRMVAEVQDYAILYLNREGIIENWNEGAQRIKGYKEKEIIGKNFRVFYTESDRKNKLPEKLLAQAVKTGKANHEGWRVRKDGSVFWGNILITALHDEKNNVIGFSKVTRDLTDKKITEEKLIKANEELLLKNQELENKNKDLESFVHVASHDLQEPLRKIQTFASRILEKENLNLSDNGKDYFIRVQNSAHRMRTLIQDLLSFSSLSVNERKFKNYDLKKIVKEVREELKTEIKEKRATIEVRTKGKVRIIPFQFRQLFQNLISNSLKFSHPEKPLHINIETRIISAGKVNKVKLPYNRDYFHIAFKDNGIGFEEQYSKKIFEVFQKLHDRNEYEGTGIGLAIVKKIVENHDGIITATGTLKRGATFDIYIPTR
jgi:PAS domain S-box-containing protein